MSAPTTTEAPRPRRYKFRANAKAGRRETGGPGAFNGTCLVYEGDEFMLTLAPCWRKVRDENGKLVKDADGKIKRVLVERAMPTWADAIEEYPIEKPAKPIRVIAGAAPTATT
jgi:hypothetical protein